MRSVAFAKLAGSAESRNCCVQEFGWDAARAACGEQVSYRAVHTCLMRHVAKGETEVTTKENTTGPDLRPPRRPQRRSHLQFTNMMLTVLTSDINGAMSTGMVMFLLSAQASVSEENYTYQYLLLPFDSVRTLCMFSCLRPPDLVSPSEPRLIR